MKRIFTIVLIVFTFTLAHSATITKTYQVHEPVLGTSSGYSTISFENMILAGIAGEPSLPYHAVKLMLPPGYEAVSIKFEGEDLVEMNGYFKLLPRQRSKPLSEVSESTFLINNEIYSSTEKYPASPTGILSTHFMNGHSFALCTFTPVQYEPASGSISYFSTVTITVETQPTERASHAIANLTSNNNAIKRCLAFADNPQQGSLYSIPSRSTDAYDILIITTQNFASQITALSDNYNDQGLITKIRTTDYIQANCSGNDLQEKIRNFIIQEYQSNGISQVILGGDVELVPYRGFYCAAQSSILYEDNNIPADLYYSALDGSWNNNNNQLWGEIGEDDLLPDISVGRLSFSNAFELSAMLNKTISYQNNPVEGELTKNLFAGENLYYNPDTWGSDYLELLIGYRTDNGYTTNGIPEAYPFEKLYDEITYWNPGDLIETINQGYPLINHVGHANDSYVAKLYVPDITNSNFYTVDGITHNYQVFYTHGCICGAFDVNDCIAEKMVSINNFAAAFVGNSRYGWFNEGQTEGPSAHLNREFIDALFTDSLNRIGSAHMESKIATSPWVNAPGQWEEGALRWCFYDCNVLGDPAMAVWTNEPVDIEPSYPSELPAGITMFEVSVSSEGNPAAGLSVALIKDNVLIGRGITNGAGIAQVLLDTIITEAGPAEIIFSGYNCKPEEHYIGFVTGINETATNSIKVFPNPAEGALTITFLKKTSSYYIIKDISGRTVKEFSIPAGVSEYTLQTDNIDPGIYLLSAPESMSGALKIIIK